MQAESRSDKALVVHDVVQSIKSLGGKFLKKDQQLGKWKELTSLEEKQKVGHAIRDAVSTYDAKKTNYSLKSDKSDVSHDEGEQSSARNNKQRKSEQNDFLLTNQSHASTIEQLSTVGTRSSQHAVTFSHKPQAQSYSAISRLSSLPLPLATTATSVESKSGFSEWLAGSYVQSNDIEGPRPSNEDPYFQLQHQQQVEVKNQHQHSHPENFDRHFLATIDDVLGPMPTDAQDPIQHLLENDVCLQLDDEINDFQRDKSS
jgi:hypothetical protein